MQKVLNIDELIDKFTEKINLRQQIRQFFKESGKWMVVILSTVIPTLLILGTIPPSQMAIFFIGASFLIFSGVALVIFKFFFEREKEHQKEILSIAVSHRDSMVVMSNELIKTETSVLTRLHNLENRMDYGVIEILMPSQRIISVNRNFVETIGFNKEDLNHMIKTGGYKNMMMSFIHPEDRHELEDVACAREEGSSIGYDVRVHYRKKDGTYFPVRMKASSVNLNGQTIVQCLIYDLSQHEDMRATIINQEFLVSELICRYLGLQKDRTEASSLIDLMKGLNEEIANADK